MLPLVLGDGGSKVAGQARVRRQKIRPDVVLELDDGRELLVVSREAMQQAALLGVAMLEMTGGSVALHVRRQQTDVVGEAVTIEAMLTWSEPVGGGVRKVLLEPDVKAAPAPEPEPEPEATVEEMEEEAVAGTDGLEEAAVRVGGGDDGFVPEVEEDVSDIPERYR